VVTLDTIGSVTSNERRLYPADFLAIFFSCLTGCRSQKWALPSRRKAARHLESAAVRAPGDRRQLGHLLDLQPDLGRRIAHHRLVRRDRGVFGNVGGAWKYVYAAVFIWFVILAAIVSLQYGKWVPTLGA
jgi:hypothetical protein